MVKPERMPSMPTGHIQNAAAGLDQMRPAPDPGRRLFFIVQIQRHTCCIDRVGHCTKQFAIKKGAANALFIWATGIKSTPKVLKNAFGPNRTLKAAPQLVSQRYQKLRARIKRKHRQQNSGDAGPNTCLEPEHWKPQHCQAPAGCGCAGSLTIGVSRTGRLIKPAKIPSAMVMYQTMS